MSSALLMLDFVTLIVDNFSSDKTVVDRAAEVLQLAREAGVPVYHVVPTSMDTQIHPAVRPGAAESVLTKSTIGAFATTDLHDRLQAAGVNELVIAGVATSGTVLSTSRWAYDVGYQVTVCKDACADPDPQAHAALTDPAVFPTSWIGLWRVASVLPTAEIGALHS